VAGADQSDGFVARTIALYAVAHLMGRRDADLGEADLAQPRLVLSEGEGARDAARVAAALGSLRRGEVVARDDVAHANPPARAQDAGHLGEHGGLVGGQVDDAVADDDVDRSSGEWNLLDSALEELDVRHTRLGGVPEREGEHLLCHVEAVRLPGRPHASGRQEDVDSAPRAEIEDALALAQLGHGRRVPAAEARQHGRLGERSALCGVVQPGSEDLRLGLRVPQCIGGLRSPGGDRDRRFGVPRPNLFVDPILLGGHRWWLLGAMPQSKIEPVMPGSTRGRSPDGRPSERVDR
jgi:hypothetical protein